MARTTRDTVADSSVIVDTDGVATVKCDRCEWNEMITGRPVYLIASSLLGRHRRDDCTS